MTTIDEHGLAALGDKLRAAVPPITAAGFPDFLRDHLTETANLIDQVLSGNATVADIPGAIEALNTAFDSFNGLRLRDAVMRFDAAADKEDPDGWRDALCELVLAMPDEEVRVMMILFDLSLQAMKNWHEQELRKMPAASEVRQ
jgi:hypothetical protein